MPDHDPASRRRDAQRAPVTETETSAALQSQLAPSSLEAAQEELGNQFVQGALAGNEGQLGSSVVAGAALEASGVASASLGALSARTKAMRRRGDEPSVDSPALAQLHEGGGRPLPEGVRQRMESAFQHDFSNVRIHLDSQAAQAAQAMSARAFALGADVFFGQGEWAPGTPAGDRLLAHELTHVVQADEGRLPSGGGVSDPSDRHEVEAYRNEDSILAALSRDVAVATNAAEPDPGPAATRAEGPAMRDPSGAGAGALGQAREYIERSTGRPLPGAIADRMAAALGHDFGHVAIHTDTAASQAADALDAHAFALGAHVFFAEGAFSPLTGEGEERLAHELAHVVQHDEGRLPAAPDLAVSSPTDSAEREATEVAAAAVSDLALGVDPNAGTESTTSTASATSLALGLAHRDVATTSDDDDDTEFERGAVVEIQGEFRIGVVSEESWAGFYGVQVVGEESTRMVISSDLAPFAGLGTLELGIEPGKGCWGVIDESLVACLVLSVSEVEEVTPTGVRVRKSVLAAPIVGDKVDLDRHPTVVSATEILAEPTYEVGSEVFGKVSDEEWRRGLVAELARPTGDRAVVAGGEGGPDGWVYSIVFERAEGRVETKTYTSDELHEAEPLTTPGPTVKPVPADEDPPKTQADEQPGPKLDPDAVAQEGGDTPAPAVDAPATGDVPIGLPVPAGAPATFTPSAPPPAFTVDLPAVDVPPVRLASPTLEPGEEKFVQDQIGVPVRQNVQDVQSSIDTIVADTSSDLQSVVDEANQSTADTTALIDTANSSFDAAVDTQKATIASVGTSAAANVDSAVATNIAVVDATTSTAVSTMDTVATTTTAALSDKEQQMRAAIEANKEKYTAAFDAAIAQQRATLEATLNGTINVIEEEAKAQVTTAKAEAKRGGSGGAEAAADEVAAKISEAKVKEKYVKAMRALAKETLDRLKLLEGDPNKVLSGKLTAPTLDDLWPAKDHYANYVKENQEKKKVEVEAAKVKYGELTTNQATQVKADVTQIQTQTDQTLDSATTALDQNTQNVAANNDEQNKAVTADLADQQKDALGQLDEASKGTQETPLAPVWKTYVAQYRAQEEEKAKQVQQAQQDGSQATLDLTQQSVSATQDDLQTNAAALNQSLVDDSVQFGTDVASNADATTTQAADITNQMSTVGTDITTTAGTQQDQALTDLDADAQAFVTGKVATVVGEYAQAAELTFEQLSNKMQEDLKTAGEKGRAAEKSDRKKRADDARAAAEYTWGTDEELYMKAVSGLTAVQGYALQNEYVNQYGEGLRYRIDDETSGSLRTSLLAWTVGDEVAAVEAAMDYSANSFWGPDVATTEAALAGLSDEGREKLKGNEEFEKNRQKMIQRCTTDRWFPDQNDTAVLAVMSDMSQSKESAELIADAIKLEDAMNRLSGTDEEGAYAILGKRDAAGNAKLAEAYAKYVYERNNIGMKWDDLPAEEKKRLAGSSLKTDLEDDFSGHEEDQALALLVGNKGLAQASKLQYSADGSNDSDMALAALDNDQLNNGDTWMDRVEGYQDKADFLQAMTDINNGVETDDAYIEGFESAEHKNKALDNVATNQQNTSDWIKEEFDGSGGVSGDESGDTVLNRMLQDKLATGQASASDMMAYGIDTAGTREKFVTQALTQIAGEADINVRLQKLEDLGNYCANFIGQRLGDPDMLKAKRNAGEGMARLPTYLTGDMKDKFPNLAGAIRNVMIALDYESSGGEQFDFELLVAQAMVRDNNVNDKWEYAVQMYANMGIGDLDDYRTDPEVIAFRTQNTTQIVDAESSFTADMSDEEKREKLHEGIGSEHEKLLAAHLLNCEQMMKDGAGVWYDAATGWVNSGPDQAAADAATKQWEAFCDKVDRVDRATKDVQRAQESLVTIICTVVAVIAAVAIAIVSLGSATWASAGLIAAAITLTAGAITMTAKYAIKGDRYGEEEFLIDLANTLADAVLNVVTMGNAKWLKLKGLGSTIDDWVKLGGGTVMRVFMGEVAKAIPGEMKNLLFNEDFWRGDNWDKIALDTILNLAKAGMTGTLTDQAKVLTGLKDAETIFDKSLESALESLVGLMSDPSKWNDDFGWEVVKALVQAGVTGVLAKGVYGHMAKRLAAKSSLTDDDWDKIKELPADIRQEMLKVLPDSHLTVLGDKAKADPETWGKLLAESGRTPVVADEGQPVQFEEGKDDPNKDDPNKDDGAKVDPDAATAIDNTTPDNAVVDPEPPKKTTLQTLNEGTLEELMALPGIGEARAKSIIADREASGPFGSVSDITRVNGIGPETQKKVQQLADVNVLDVLNHGSKEELMTIPGIGEAKAQKILDYRNQPDTKPFTRVDQIQQVHGIGDVLANQLQARQKMACVDADPTTEIAPLKNKFKEDVDRELAANPELDPFTVMKRVVRNDDGIASEQYKLQGPKIPVDAIAAYKGLTRVVGMESVYKYHMTDATREMLKNAHGIVDSKAFIDKLKADPTFFKKAWIDTTSMIKGQNDVAWWTPVKTDGSTSYKELIEDRALDPKYYDGGAVEFVVGVDSTVMDQFRRPTVFDGMLFGEYALPPKDGIFGVTAGGQEEAVAPPISVGEASDVRIFLP